MYNIWVNFHIFEHSIATNHYQQMYIWSLYIYNDSEYITV